MQDTSAPRVIVEEALRGGQMWSRVLRRGQSLRLTDLEGGAAVAALFYNADDKLERYNMPDTLKAQHTARLTRGHVLYSDMGRVLCAITEDSLGHHDTITGHGTRTHQQAKYGEGSYQKLRNDFYRNSRDNFLVELGKHELGLRDIVANVNWFVKVAVDDFGRLSFVPDHSKPGSYVELRAELNTLVVLSNTPHPMDPRRNYAPGPVALTVYDTVADSRRRDVCRLSCPENARGFALTDAYFE
ncbi:MAG TPA: urea amidolyase associated protein UAAP1 [Polyangiaceae bacterium]|nr:urea amidolyase associated protein UAAP1 [Polyangiaceae bacterium]